MVGTRGVKGGGLRRKRRTVSSRLALAPRARQVLLAAAALLQGGCSLVQSGPQAPEGPAPASAPAIEEGTLGPAALATAREALDRAREAFEDGDYARALTRATTVVTQFAAAPGSAEALWIQAVAAARQEEWAVARQAAERYQGLVPLGDPTGGSALVVQAQAAHAQEGPASGIQVFLAAEAQRARAAGSEADNLIREWVRDVPTAQLAEVSEGVDEAHPLLPPVLLEYGIGLHFAGEIEASERVARQVLTTDADNQDREVARSLLNGSIEETRAGAVSIGLLVPRSGSPTLQEYANWVQEGVEVALQVAAEQRRRPIRLEAMDDGSNESAADRALITLESGGAVAVVGPLLDRGLEAAVAVRQNGMPIVSPTASRIPGGVDGVYSLAAPDAGSAIALADHASDAGYRRLAVIHSRELDSDFEAQAFADAYRERGNGQVARFGYDPGQTTFGAVLGEARSFGADALVIAVPDQDVELLAPQITFHGFDTLGVAVLATAPWGESSVLDVVDPRHTSGVVVASPREPEGENEAYRQFQTAYETLHRKTLRSPVPAFGYDAALLVLRAIEEGARSPGEMTEEIERTEDFPGATGRLSVQDGRITRHHTLYEIRDRTLVPTGRTFRP